MSDRLDTVGRDWLIEEVSNWTERIDKVTPTQFVEENRYLPASVTPMPGYLNFDINPYMREILDCFDVDSPVREVSLMKGVQITYTTAVLENVFFYFMAHVKTAPVLYMTADAELAQARIDNNFIPMIEQSNLRHLIRSSDTKNTRKTGMTKKHIQWEGGGYMIPFGAINANKMRQISVMVLLKDEIDGWPDSVGNDGDPDKLSDDRTSAYTEQRKILRGSTPLLKDTSKIYRNYMMGDQRKYFVHCRSCGHPQYLEWSGTDKKTGLEYGVQWETEEDILIPGSVRYVCRNCGHAHIEADKTILFSAEHGAHWRPTAKSKRPNVRSYHLPGLYSPYNFRSWEDQVADWLEAFNPNTGQTKDIDLLQVFYNNVLAEPFEVRGSKIHFTQVSAHRRMSYSRGQIPNQYALKHSGSRILMLTMQVDVQKSFLAVAVFGWCIDSISYLIDYWHFKDEDCTDPNSPVWGKVNELIEEKVYASDTGEKYFINTTFIDANFTTDVVVDFCARYEQGVFPIMGRDALAKKSEIKGFGEGVTPLGTTHVLILVDKFKDRMAPVLRREWNEGAETQKTYHFNAPIDILDDELMELTKETRKKKVDERGNARYYWVRKGNARNELWDLLIYGSAAIEFSAYKIMRDEGIEKFMMNDFWVHADKENLFILPADESKK